MATTSDEKILTEALQLFNESKTRWSENRTASLNDIKFGRLGEQWPAVIAKKRKEEDRPMLTINRIPSFLRQVTNDARQNKPSIKVNPVDSGSDPKTAGVIQGLVRNIQAQSDADVAYDTAVDNAASAGIGYFRIDIDHAHNDSFEKDICIRPIENIMSVHHDANTKEFDSSDWEYCFVSDMIPEARFKAQYKDAEPIDWKGSEGLEDWTTENSVRVAEYWRRTEYERKLLLMSNQMVIDADRLPAEKFQQLLAMGFTVIAERAAKGYKITHRLMTGKQILRTTEWVGSIIPVVPVYGEVVNVEGRRHWRSLFRDAKDSQTMLNFWRTASTEMVALAPKSPWVGPAKAFEGYEDVWEKANIESFGYLPYNDKSAVAPQRIQSTPLPAAQIQEALQAGDDMKSIMGIYDASLGARSNETSGRAIMARQREGDVGTFHFMDNLTRSIRCAGRIIIEMIPHVYNRQRVVRVLGDDGKPDLVTINERVVSPDDGVTKVLNDLTAGKYDVVVETGPSYTTQRQEAADAMTQLVQSFPDAAPILGDLIAKNMDWPDADKVAERLRYLLPPQIREAEDAKNQAGDNLEALQTALAQAQGEIQKRDQALQQMAGEGKNVATERAALERAKNDLEKMQNKLDATQKQIDIDRKAFAEQQRMATEQIQLQQDKAVAKVEAAVASATKQLGDLARQFQPQGEDDADEMENGEGPEPNPQMDAMIASQAVLAEAMSQIAAAFAAPRTMSMTGADGVTRTGRSEIAPQ